MSETTGRVLRFIADYLEEYRYPPTLREIARGVGRVHSVVVHHVEQLDEEGLIGRGPKGASRALWVTERGRQAVEAQEVRA